MRSSSLTLTGYLFGLIVAMSGCGNGEKEFQEAKDEGPVAEVEHDHHHEDGPHGGHVIELGDDEYHAELVFDEKTKKITVYIAGHEPDETHAIEADEITLNLMIGDKPTAFQLAANPDENDPEGKSSRFELVDNEVIQEHIGDEEDIKGRINVTIGGKPFTGEIEHDHGHDDEHDDDHDDDHDDKHHEDGHDDDKEHDKE